MNFIGFVKGGRSFLCKICLSHCILFPNLLKNYTKDMIKMERTEKCSIVVFIIN